MSNVLWDCVKYFSEWEFQSPDTKSSNMNYEFILKLDSLRDLVGFPIKITSGFRTKEYNELIGGVVDSSHCIGEAVDIHCTDSVKRLAIINKALLLGITRIGISETFIHLDIDKDKSSCIWVY